MTKLTKAQHEFLQARYEAAEEGRGEYLAPAEGYDLEDCWQANHYKLNYRTTSMLLLGWDHYIGGDAEELGMKALDAARDFIRPIHPYWDWALSPQPDRDDELGDAHEEAGSEFERLFWIHWESWIGDLPPEIQQQQAEEDARYREQQDKNELNYITTELAYLQALPKLEPDPLDPKSQAKLQEAEQIAAQMLTDLQTAAAKPYPRFAYDHSSGLRSDRRKLDQLRKRKTQPRSLDETRASITSRGRLQIQPEELEDEALGLTRNQTENGLVGFVKNLFAKF